MSDARACRAVADALTRARRTLITTHIRPDGDAIGSTVGLWRVLTDAGRRAELVWLDDVPPRYAFVAAGVDWHRWGRGFAAGDVGPDDLLCIVDTSSYSQLEPAAEFLRTASQTKVVIDHHQTRDPIGDPELVDVEAGAAAQMVAQLCEFAGWAIRPAAAEALFVGVATDTGWFRHSNTSPQLLTVAASLVARGARTAELYERIYLGDPAPRVRLFGRALAAMRLFSGDRVALLTLPRSLLDEVGATTAMTEDLVNEPLRIGSVVASVLCTESADGPIRISLRSKRDIDVAALAQRHGGGGHARAAGARLTGPLEQAAATIVAELVAALPPAPVGGRP